MKFAYSSAAKKKTHIREETKKKKKKLSPLMQQYKDLKSQYPDAILFCRVGDFYETYYEDAEIAARTLSITLTSRDKTSEWGPVPMAGVPYHAIDSYLYKMVKASYAVAICEQMEDPKEAKGLLKREVIRVITPGTVTDPKALERKANNYLVAISHKQKQYGLAHVDLSTGEFSVTELEAETKLLAELTRIFPAECLLTESFDEPELMEMVEANIKPVINRLPDWRFDVDTARSELVTHFHTLSLDGFGCEHLPAAISAAGALIYYLNETQKQEVQHISSINTYSVSDFMILDADTQRNLELARSLRDSSEKGTLLEVLDETLTPMGGRKLRQYMLQPLLTVSHIHSRLNAVEELYNKVLLQEELREQLNKIYDMERLITRANLGSANARDLLALKDSLRLIPPIKEKLEECESTLLDILNEQLEPLVELADVIDNAIQPDPPVTIREGRLIKDGCDEELDKLRKITTEGKNWITGLQKQERERTGISSLKIGYNQVFGYYIEVTKANFELVPENYIRKQTLTNAERFITPELKDQEAIILNAQEGIHDVEYKLFCQIRDKIVAETERVQKAASIIAVLDVLTALAYVAAKYNYTKPVVEEGDEIIIKDGRHPVVERLFTQEGFVPNDCSLNCEEHQLHVITGPNMSGKCLRKDTLVFTNNGTIPISDCMIKSTPVDTFTEIGIQVKGLNGIETASHFYNGGRQKTIRIKTKLGYELEGTPEHRVWVRFPDEPEGWKCLRDITKGDYVAIDRHIDLWGNKTAIEFDGSFKKSRIYPTPKELNSNLAYMMGLLVGDGTLTYRHTYVLTTADEFIRDEFYRINQEQFGYPVKRRSGRIEFLVYSVYLRKFLKTLGLDYSRAHEKYVPSTILQAPKEIAIAFLQGLFDTDGTAENRYGNVRLSTSSSMLAKQVQMLLLNLGIISSLQVKKTDKRDNFRIFINGEDAILFYEKVGFRLPRKQARRKLQSSLRRPNVGAVPHLEQTLKDVQKRIVEKKDKPVALKKVKDINSIFYTYLPNGRNISYDKMRSLMDYCYQNGVNCPELEAIENNHYFYDSVELIEESEAEVYDLNVPGTHSFVANGFVNHNSTYLRQVALITLMAQMGSFVPASAAKIGVADRIFTRVGASDNLVMGQSTFLVEMNETANILNNATNKSLIILDEIGRGTSTFDGLSIAWAVAEYILDEKKIGAKTLFATHYHELIELEKKYKRVKNYNVAVHEDGERIVFLRKVVEGGTDDSYGIQVARLAGLPQQVIARASQILTVLEEHNISVDDKSKPKPKRRARRETFRDDSLQLSLFMPKAHPVVDDLKSLELNNMTPLEALNKLNELKSKAEKN